MSRTVLAIVLFAMLGVQPALAKGTTAPGPWLLIIKDALRQKINNPQYVTFTRIFLAGTKTDNGAFPVCGFVNFKQMLDAHQTKQPFFALFTPPDGGKAGSMASIQVGATTEQAAEIATICKNYGL